MNRHRLRVALVAGAPLAVALQAAPLVSQGKPLEEVAGQIQRRAERSLEAGAESAPPRAMDQWYEGVLKPRIAAARTCNQRMRALQGLIQWERQRQLHGLAPERGVGEGPVGPYWQEARDVCIEEAYQRCVQQHDLRMVFLLRSIQRIDELMGDGSDRAQEYARRCGHFELELDALTRTDVWQAGGRTLVPITVAEDAPSGEAPVEFSGPTALDRCFRFDNTVRDPLARLLRIELAEGEADPRDTLVFLPEQPYDLRQLAILLSPGVVESRMTVGDGSDYCGDPQTGLSGWPGLVMGSVPELYEALVQHGEAGLLLIFRADHGELPQGRLYAARDFRPEDPFQGQVSAILWHRPK